MSLPLFPEPDDRAAPTLREIADAVREAGLEGLPDARERADRARYQEVHVRSGMVETRGMPFRFALNPYRGCTHACEYCYARKYQKHLELDAGDAFSSVILVKRNLPEVLRREVSRRTWTRELVAVGTATDPYQPIEGHYRITRRCLEVLAASETPFSVVTKGPMIVRDADVIARGAEGTRIFVSVPSVDEEAWARLEPGTAPPVQRIRAAQALGDAGIDVSILMMPLVPGITTSRQAIARTVEAIARSGVPLGGAGVAHLEAGVRDYFFGFLAREYPSLLDGYRRLYTNGWAPADYRRAVTAVVDEAERAAAGLERAATPPL